MDHPSDEVLARVAEGEVRSEGELAEHLRSCRTCTEVLSGLLRARTGTGLDDTARSTRSSDGAPKVHQTIGGAEGRAADPERAGDHGAAVGADCDPEDASHHRRRLAEAAERLVRPI